ncbi:MAG: RIP metalloprotease RseP [Ignavibacteria bacterium]|nr:RIP metalloprotease RseP [Ignavibacteria bacterium]
MEALPTVFYFLVVIGILVLVHELGHFLAAKFFGMRVDRFSIGFPPRAFGKKIGDTDYCVSWVPIGGYVKIAGMVDESLDTDFVNEEPKPWEFRSKPIWQRMIVICAGVVMNIFLAILIFWGIIFYQGKTVKPVTEIGYVVPESPAAKAGFLMGDVIVDVNGKRATHWEEIENSVYSDALSGNLAVTIRRNGKSTVVNIVQPLMSEILESGLGLQPAGLVALVTNVETGKPADQAGLKPGDVILDLNGQGVSFHSLQQSVKRYAGKEVTFRWKREGEANEARLTPSAEGKIGVGFLPMYNGPLENVRYSLLAALPEGIKDAWNMSWMNLKSIYQIFAGRVSLSKSVAGPIMIAKMVTRSAEMGAINFLGFMALLSMNLAIINLLPFPALDGGHAMFLVYEAVFRREIPSKVKIALQQAGFVLLLVFMAFVLYNDVIKF